MGLRIIHDEAERRRTPDRRGTAVAITRERRVDERRSDRDRRKPGRVPLPTCEIEMPAEIEAKPPAEREAWVQAARARWRHEQLEAHGQAPAPIGEEG